MISRLLLLLVLVGLAHTAGPNSAAVSLQDKAAAERRLVIYGDTNLRDLQVLANAFQAKFGFVKDVELLSLSVDRLFSKITTEFMAGTYNPDVITFAVTGRGR